MSERTPIGTLEDRQEVGALVKRTLDQKEKADSPLVQAVANLRFLEDLLGIPAIKAVLQEEFRDEKDKIFSNKDKTVSSKPYWSLYDGLPQWNDRRIVVTPKGKIVYHEETARVDRSIRVSNALLAKFWQSSHDKAVVQTFAKMSPEQIAAKLGIGIKYN